MAMICDTGGVLALYDASNVDHAATATVVEAIIRSAELLE
jgi:hypothetical protein